MSKEVISQIVEQKCEGCGAKKVWEVVGAPEALNKVVVEMQDWYTVSRKVVVNGQLTKIEADACSLACVPVAAVKLALPPQSNGQSDYEEPADGIDLNSLRKQNLPN